MMTLYGELGTDRGLGAGPGVLNNSSRERHIQAHEESGIAYEVETGAQPSLNEKVVHSSKEKKQVLSHVLVLG